MRDNNQSEENEDASLRSIIDRDFDILSSPIRRKLLYSLEEYGETHLNDAADEVYRRMENDDQQELRVNMDEKMIGVNLHHYHIPRMEDEDILNYDSETKMIEPELDSSIQETLNRAKEYSSER